MPASLPMFTSHCPGWVCYAEKTSAQAIPYMSTVKSPQQIVGAIMKNLLLSFPSSSVLSVDGNDNGSFDLFDLC
jgi:iron only hydrogenase large subunit-like protein